MNNWLHDLRYAFRQLRKSPGFTIAALLTLAMAIGANAVVFSVLNGFILKPLNVPDPQSLYLIESSKDNSTVESYPDYIDLRDRNHSFDGLAGFGVGQFSLNTGLGPSLIWGLETSSNYFDVLRVNPYLGRFFHDSDDHGPNSAPYVVLSYDYWHSQLHEDRSLIGRVVQLNQHPFTILGVAPPQFRGTIVFMSPTFFVPLVNHAQIDAATDMNDRGARWIFLVVGHLKPGVTKATAIADLNSIGSYLEKTYPQQERQSGFALARPNFLGDQAAPAVQAFIGGLMLLATLIFLAACANLGTMFAARAADRSKEVAVRMALGSSRKRILRGLFIEAVLVSLAGGGIGLWGSVAFLHWFSLSRLSSR
jgi:predicted permease